MLTLLILILLYQGITVTSFNQYSPGTSSSCQCEKGERGEKGDPGTCPANCGWRYNTYSRDCLGPRINLERLAQSIRQLIVDTKKIAYGNARRIPCVCPAAPTATHPPIYNPFFHDYHMFIRMKGDKGDPGDTCTSNCVETIQSNVRVFTTLQEAMDESCTYPDHTYVHIVNEYGCLESVFIRVNGKLVSLRLETEHALPIPDQIFPTPISIPNPKCRITLPCPTLHLFALGPQTRRMCRPRYPDIACSKLSDYDDLCERVSSRHHLKGFYRAFMSSSTQWLANLFTGICINARIVNMNEQVLFDSFEEIFEHKPVRNEILDVQGFKPQFRYWWHGSLPNGTASKDTCLDWSRQDSSLSGIVSRLPDGMNGLFDYQYLWPCSISDSNMGILCIETNCDKRNYYKH